MSPQEQTKTIGFVGLAALAALLAWIIQPSAPSAAPEDEVGGIFFPSFTDPPKAVGLEVVSFDETTGEAKSFQVTSKNGAWVIPSHENYPADAQMRMKNAAAALIGLPKLGVASDDRATHQSYGVKDPEDAAQGDAGVGTLVRLSDVEGGAIATLVVGKEAEQPGLRYVRLPKQDRVYVTKVSLADLSTNFGDWIEKDFLNLDAWNIARVVLDGHHIDETQGLLVPGEKLTISHDASGKPKWTMAGLEESQSLDEAKLDALKTAIDDLRIVHVTRKPDLLIENLRQGREFFADLRDPKNGQIVESLMAKGFFPAQLKGQKELSVFSNEGQIFVDLKDGVRYVLRFGEITNEGKPVALKEEAKDAPAPEAAGSNRYIMVLAQLASDLIKKPELEALPEKPSEPEPKPEAPASDADAKKDAPAAAAPEKTEEQKKADAELAKKKAEYDRIKAANDRKTKAYQGKIDKAKKRVEELNARFADWYYVIDDQIYRKIKLDRSQIVIKKVPSAAEKNQAEADKFLTENKSKDGVKVTDSGLQYQVLAEGEGASPKATDTVRVHYKGTLIDGTVFDESKGDPAEFPVNGVIKGWTEALQLMKPGAKWRLFIPTQQSYGDPVSGEKIGPNSALIFDVELVGIR